MRCLAGGLAPASVCEFTLNVTNEVDYRRLAELAHEFKAFFDRLHGFYLDAAAGFGFVRGGVEAEQAHARMLVKGTELDDETFQDTRLFTYSDIFIDSFVASSIHMPNQGEVKRRNAIEGENFTTLGQLCVTAFYDYWNEYLRRGYVIAKGKLSATETNDEAIKAALRDHGGHDLWGDLRHLRASIVHNGGVATSDVAKCKLIKWFQPNDKITLGPPQMRAIFLALLGYHTELFKEQFPPGQIFIKP